MLFGNKYEPSDSAFHLQTITSVEDLEEFEQKLADSVDTQNQTIERLKKVGGSNIGDHVRNIAAVTVKFSQAGERIIKNYCGSKLKSAPHSAK